VQVHAASVRYDIVEKVIALFQRYNVVVHNPVNTAISFGLLIAVVGGSFFYVYSGGPVEVPKEPWIGIATGGILTQEEAEALGHEQGFLIVSITPGGPADKAGLRGANNVTVIGGQEIPVGGDVIVSMDDRRINAVEDICAALTQRQVGDSMNLVIDREGNLQEVDLILEELPPQARFVC
jgi:S1-C subfamily serine protease